MDKISVRECKVWIGYWIALGVLFPSYLLESVKQSDIQKLGLIISILFILVPSIVMLVLFVLDKSINKTKYIGVFYMGIILAYMIGLVFIHTDISFFYITPAIVLSTLISDRRKALRANVFSLVCTIIILAIKFKFGLLTFSAYGAQIIALIIFLIISDRTAVCNVLLEATRLNEAKSLLNLANDRKQLIEDAIKVISKEMNSLNGSINDSNNQNKTTYNSLTEISRVVEEISKSLDKQTTESGSLGKQLHEIDIKSKDIGTSCNKFKKTINMNSKGLSSIKEKVLDINKTSNDMYEYMEDLNRNSENIASSLNIIKEISRQTNMLSLNATIEAARAGDNGKGFAVVAMEIGDLVKKTDKATEEISFMMSNFNSSINNLYDLIKVSNTKVNEQTDLVDEINEAFVSTVKDFEVMDESITYLADAVNISVTNINKVVSEIESMSSICEEVSATTIELTNSSKVVSKSMDTISGNSNKIDLYLQDTIEKLN